MGQNDIDIGLRFSVDKNSERAAKTAIENIVKGARQQVTQSLSAAMSGQGSPADIFAALKSYADGFGTSIEGAAEAMQRTYAVGYKTKDALLADVQAFRQMEAEANKTAVAVEKIERNTAKIGRNSSTMMLGMTGFSVMMAGMQLGRVGQAMLSPMQAYVEYAGRASAISSQWLETTRDIELSKMRIGREMSESLLPVMREGAKLVSSIATFVERYPGIASAATTLAGGTLAISGLMMVTGQIMSGIAAFKGLAAILGLGKLAGGIGTAVGTAGKVAGGVAAGAGGAVTGGVGLGVVGYNALAEATGRASAGTIIGQALTAATYKSFQNSLLSGSAEEAALWVGRLTGVIDKLGTESQEAGEGLIGEEALQQGMKLRQQAAEAYENYARAERDAAEQYGAERARLVADFTRQTAREEEDFTRQRAQTVRDFWTAERRQEVDYYRTRLQLAARYGEETQRQEEDFQRAQAARGKEHELKMRELADSRDALGMLREMQRYDLERSEAEETFRTQRERRQADYARQLAEQAQQFASQRERRLADFKQRMADEDAERKIARARAEADHRRQLADLERRNNEEQRKRAEAYNRQLSDLGKALQIEFDLKAKYYAAEVQYLQTVIAGLQRQYSAPSGTSRTGSRAGGGYAPYGLYWLGDRAGGGAGPVEYVLDGATTRLAERVIGGKLTQQKLAAVLMGGGGGRALQMDFAFYGDLSPTQMDSIERRFRRIANDTIVQAFGGAA
jgi:hypothetical protein